MKTNYRCRHTIFYEILTEMKLYHTQTRIGNRSNLTWKSTLSFLNHLVKNGLAEIDKNFDYYIAPKGYEYMKQYERLNELVSIIVQ